MHIKLSFPFITAFLLLTIVMFELHETAHIVVGRIICGCWGERDFNVWALCSECDQSHPLYWIATLAGPIFSFLLMWLGMYWLSSSNLRTKAVGFSLIFANIPFGRISEVFKGAGDEMVVTRHLLKNDFTPTEMILVCSVFVLALGVPPIIKAYNSLTNKRPWLYVVGFLTLPIAFILVYILIGMNSLLTNGFLSTIVIMGTPLLITIHTAIAIVLLVLVRKNLYVQKSSSL